MHSHAFPWKLKKKKKVSNLCNQHMLKCNNYTPSLVDWLIKCFCSCRLILILSQFKGASHLNITAVQQGEEIKIKSSRILFQKALRAMGLTMHKNKHHGLIVFHGIALSDIRHKVLHSHNLRNTTKEAMGSCYCLASCDTRQCFLKWVLLTATDKSLTGNSHKNNRAF